MSGLSDWTEYALLSGFLGLARSMPRPAALGIARRLGDFLFDAVRIRRVVCLDNLRQAFPERSEKEILRIARSCYRNFAQTAVEGARLPHLSRETIIGMGEIRGREHVEWVASQGRGAILLTGHLGNWEWGGALLPALGYPTQVVVARQHNRHVGDMMDRIRRGTGVGILSAETDLRGIMRALREGNLVAIVADQDAGRDGVFVEFLGRLASTAVGPVRLAQRFGVPILPGFTLREPDGRYRLDLLPPIIVPQGREDAAVIATYTEAWSRMLERYVREHPEQWFWMHRRWKTRPPGIASSAKGGA